MTDDPDVRMAQSIMDYIFRRLALDYMSFEERSMLGIYSAQERQRHLETGSYEPLIEETGSADELITEAHESVPIEQGPTAESAVVAQGAREPRRPDLRGAPGATHRYRRRLPALPHLRDQDAPRGVVLRL